MSLSEVMGAFASEVGIVDAEPDGMGAYHLDIDGMAVSFMEVGEYFAVWAEVGDVPPVGRERFYEMLMESMFPGEQSAGTAGSSFSVDPDLDKVCLHRFDALAVLTPESFKAILESFCNVLEQWRGVVADYREETPDRNRAEEVPAGEGLGEFMRV